AAAREQVGRALEEAVLPTYQRYLDALTDYRTRATETIGLVDLPGGDAVYRSQILAWTSLEMDPEEIHRIGLEELEAIQEERRTIAARLGFDDAELGIGVHTSSGAECAATRVELGRR